MHLWVVHGFMTERVHGDVFFSSVTYELYSGLCGLLLNYAVLIPLLKKRVLLRTLLALMLPQHS